MALSGESWIIAYLQRQAIAGLGADVCVRPAGATADELRYVVTSDSGRWLLICATPSATDRVERARAGLTFAGGLGLAPVLVHAATDGPLGGPVLLIEAPDSSTLGERPLTPREAHDWLFLLLTLHHLPPAGIAVRSSTSTDIASWWQRTMSTWQTCRAATAGTPALRPLLDALDRLRVIGGVHVEAHRSLWDGVRPRPCHGNPVPANVILDGGRMLLAGWEQFGLGDVAMDIGNAAVRATLGGALSVEQYTILMADYARSTRDMGDAGIEQRLRVIASVVPLGVAMEGVTHLAGASVGRRARAHQVEHVGRALGWVQHALGVVVGDTQPLLEPLRQPG